MNDNFFVKVEKLIRVLLWCLSLSWKASRLYTILRLLVEVTTPLLAILVAYIGRTVINVLAGQIYINDAQQYLIILLSGIFFIGVMQAILKKAAGYCQTMHEDMLRGQIALVIMEHGLSADLEYFDNPDYYDKLQTASQDSHATIYVVWNALSSVSATISFISIFLILLQANPLYGIVITVTAIPASIITAKYTKLLYGLNIAQVNGMRKMGYCQGLSIERVHAQELRLFQAGEKLKKRYIRIWSELFEERKKMAKRRTILITFLGLLPEIAVVWIAIHIAFLVLDGAATVGDYSFFTGLIGQLLGAIAMLSGSLMSIYDNKMQLENYKTIEKFHNQVIESGELELYQVDTIEFDNVCFRYPATTIYALNGVNFNLRKEEKVAIVGMNGSGKSTIIKLLLRLYDPESGTIRINGIDIKSYKQSSLRANFSVYFQDMYNYSLSLRENFTISNGEVDSLEEKNDGQEIIVAMENAQCDDVLKKTNRSLDVGITRYFDNDGIELSGGQHQKLALARTFYRKHTVLILDEPSSNLDPKAEHDIFEILKTITNNKMTIFTSHRLSNVFLADRIIVMEEGRVIEDGRQSELLANQHRYAELFRYQQEKFSDVVV